MLSNYDYIVIAFYFVFMTLMSWVFKRFIRNTSDYFRGGGEMLWWMAGAGAFMVSFSAVTFTGMAGKAFEDGPVVLVIFVGNALGFLINYFWFAPVSRQTRAVTAMEVVRARFGKVSEQFFTWLQIPVGTFYAGLWLMGLCVFVSAGFGWNLNFTIIITGAVVLVMALLGGSWSVMAGDFVQMLILMPVSIVAAVLALNHVGGVGEFVEKVPTKFWNWSEAGSWNIIGLWIIATLLQKFVSTNSMQDCSRYLSVKDSRHAKWAAMLGFVLFIIGPAVWFIPPMVTRIMYPDLKAMFPDLEKPVEAAYFAIAIKTMPAGMVGLLLSGIFGATMSSMDGGLNKNAGFFVKNFYQPYLHPHASEKELLVMSKISTTVLGLLIIGAGLIFANWKDLTIFEMMTYFSGLVGLPVAVPLTLGMIFRRAPGWAGWSTVLVGLTTSILVNQFLSVADVQRMFNVSLNKREASDWVFLSGTFASLVVQCAWFAVMCAIGLGKKRATDEPGGTQATAKEEGGDYATLAAIKDLPEAQRVPALFALMKKPVDFHAEENSAGSDNAQAKIMGFLCIIYGGFVMLLMAIPNSMGGRFAFAFCGGSMVITGWLLSRAGRGHTATRTAVQAKLVASEGT
jgi:SSS family transporter